MSTSLESVIVPLPAAAAVKWIFVCTNKMQSNYRVIKLVTFAMACIIQD